MPTPEQLEARRKYSRTYRLTPHGKAAIQKANRKYFSTPKGKATLSRNQQKYWRTHKGKELKRKADKKYYRADPGRHAACNFKVKYGITQLEANQILEKQGFACVICRCQIAMKSDTTPATARVDHNHITRKVRGLLCNNCNVGLGHFRDSLYLLRNAQQYLLDTC